MILLPPKGAGTVDRQERTCLPGGVLTDHYLAIITVSAPMSCAHRLNLQLSISEPAISCRFSRSAGFKIPQDNVLAICNRLLNYVSREPHWFMEITRIDETVGRINIQIPTFGITRIDETAGRINPEGRCL